MITPFHFASEPLVAVAIGIIQTVILMKEHMVTSDDLF
jgi:hypothetical protein